MSYLCGENPLVSVIIPAYNVEKYIGECLESVRNQTYQNLEIIFVDNNSSDSTLEIAERYALKDSRIRILSEPVIGISEARNRGIDSAYGEWVLWVDADDYVIPEAVETLLERAYKDNVSVCCGTYYALLTKNGKTKKVSVKERILETKEEAVEYFFSEGRGFCHLWQKLCKREIFKTSPFLPGRKYEDIFFMPELLTNANRISVIDFPFYYHRVREGSTVFDKNIQTHMDGLDARVMCRDFIKKEFPQYVSLAEDTVLEYACYLLGKIWGNGRKSNLNFWDKTTDIFTKAINEAGRKSFGVRAAILVFKVSPRLLGRLCRIYSYLQNGY